MSLPNTSTEPLDLTVYFQRCYEENLSYFQQHHPELYTFALSHRPKNATLAISDAGYPTLIDVNTQQQLTEEDPRQEIANYLARSTQSPDFITYGPKTFSRKSITAQDHVALFLKDLNAAVPPNDAPCQLTPETPIPLAICFGQQLGHITALAPDTYNIRHLVIYEPDPDHFYASLFVQRYAQLNKPFDSDYRSITFVIGDCPNRLCNAIYDLVRQSGYFLIANMLLLESRPTERTQAAKKQFKNLAPRLTQGWGYFSDEMRGLAQTLENANRGMNIFTPEANAPKPLADIPCCVVGNGPSLDRCLDFLKQHHASLFIISAGSTLHTLLKNNITPDLHVEIERTDGTYQHLNRLAAGGSYTATDTDTAHNTDDTKNPLSNIPLMTLNTIVPQVTSLFDNAYALLKEGDLGSEMLIEHQHTPNAVLPLTHPLVGNGAAAIAVRLGCKHIYLMGMDLSVTDTGLIHSTDSVYNDPAHPLKESERRFNYTTQGNLGGTVQTDSLYDSSRLSLELLIDEHPDRTFFNIGDGIRIIGTTPLQGPKYISVTNNLDKHAALVKTLQSFTPVTISRAQVGQISGEVITNTAHTLQQMHKLLWPKKSTTADAVLTSFADQINILTHSKKNSAAPFRLLKGAMAYLQTQIVYNLLFITTDKARQKYIQHARNMLIRYFKVCKEQLEYHLPNNCAADTNHQ